MSKLAPGRLDVVENKAQHPGEPDVWLRVYLLPETGQDVVQAFFTPKEITTAVERVLANREDLAGAKPPVSLLDRFQRAVNETIDRFKNDHR